MKKEWYVIFAIWLGLPLCIAVLLGLLISHAQPRRNLTDIKKCPGRIVSLAPNLTEILFALGLDEKIVAVSSDSDYPARAANRKQVGTFWRPNTEAIIASRPDLVIALWFEQQKAAADSLKRLGYQVLSLRIERIEQLLLAISKIGMTTGHEQRADEIVTSIRNGIDDIRSKVTPAGKTKVLWVIQTEPLRVAGRNTFINELIEVAGGQNAIGPTIQQYPQIGTEQLLVCGAEVIIQSAMGTDNIAEQQHAAEALWSKRANLRAVKNNRIHVINPDTVLRLGPRLPEGIEMVAHYLHPDIFEQTPDDAQAIR